MSDPIVDYFNAARTKQQDDESPWQRALSSAKNSATTSGNNGINLFFELMSKVRGDGQEEGQQEPVPPKQKPRRADPNAVRVAREEIKRTGIPLEQSAGYSPLLSNALYSNVNPQFDYYDDSQAKTIAKDVWSNLTNKEHRSMSQSGRNREHLRELEDAWRIYLGMPQNRDSFGVSDYVPSQSTGNVPYYYKFNNFMDILMRDDATDNEGLDSNARMRKLVEKVRAAGGSMPSFDDTELGWALKNHTLGVGQDEKGHYLSYYDKWDLAPQFNGSTWDMTGVVGKPFEIYDRVYFNPETYETDPPWPPRPEVKPLWQTQYLQSGGPSNAPPEDQQRLRAVVDGERRERREREELGAMAESGLPLDQMDGDPEIIIDLFRKYGLYDKYAKQYEMKNKKPFYEPLR